MSNIWDDTVFSPDPPAGPSASACFWNAPVRATEPCGDDPLLVPYNWLAWARSDRLFLGLPSAAPVLFRSEYDTPPGAINAAQIWDTNLAISISYPGFQSAYSGVYTNIQVFKCDPDTGEVLQTYDIDEVEWTGDTDYPLTGMPTIDPDFAWYATFEVDLTHDSNPSLNITEFVYAPVILGHTVVLHSVDGFTAGDGSLVIASPSQYGTFFAFNTIPVGMHPADIPEAALDEFGELDSEVPHTASVTIDGTLYTVTFSATSAG